MTTQLITYAAILAVWLTLTALITAYIARLIDRRLRELRRLEERIEAWEQAGRKAERMLEAGWKPKVAEEEPKSPIARYGRRFEERLAWIRQNQKWWREYAASRIEAEKRAKEVDHVFEVRLKADDVRQKIDCNFGLFRLSAEPGRLDLNLVPEVTGEEKGSLPHGPFDLKLVRIEIGDSDDRFGILRIEIQRGSEDFEGKYGFNHLSISFDAGAEDNSVT